jgi:hypothetical protein
MNNIINNHYLITFISIIIIIYSGSINKHFSRLSIKLYNNQIVKIIYLICLYLLSELNINLGISMAILYITIHIYMTNTLINNHINSV